MLRGVSFSESQCSFFFQSVYKDIGVGSSRINYIKIKVTWINSKISCDLRMKWTSKIGLAWIKNDQIRVSSARYYRNINQCYMPSEWRILKIRYPWNPLQSPPVYAPSIWLLKTRCNFLQQPIRNPHPLISAFNWFTATVAANNCTKNCIVSSALMLRSNCPWSRIIKSRDGHDNMLSIQRRI